MRGLPESVGSAVGGGRSGDLARAGRRRRCGERGMNKRDISSRVAARLRLRKAEAEAAVDTVFEAIGESLAREEAVRIAGFGTLATRSREARTGRNPGTGEKVAIPASKAPAFRAARALRDRVKRGPEPGSRVSEDDGDMRGRGPGESGQALDVSVWPGGLEPVRKLLDRESLLAVGNEPSAENRALRLATDLTEAEVAGSAFVRNALILLGEIGGEETVWTTNDGRLEQGRCRADAGLDVLAGDEGDRTVPDREVVLRAAGGGAASAAVVTTMAGLIEPAGFWFELTPLGRAMLEARKRRSAAGASVPSGIQAQGSFEVRERPAPEPAGLVAAGRYRRGSVVDFRRGGGLPECGHPDGVMHGPGRHDADGGALGSGGHDVRAARPRSAPLVRAGGISGAGGFVRCPVAQDRPLRPLPAVRRAVRGRPHEGALAGHDDVAPSGGGRDCGPRGVWRSGRLNPPPPTGTCGPESVSTARGRPSLRIGTVRAPRRRRSMAAARAATALPIVRSGISGR